MLLLPRLAAKDPRWHAPLLSLFGSTLVLHVSLGLGKEGSGLEADAVTLLRELYAALLQAGCDEPRQLLLRDGGLEQAAAPPVHRAAQYLLGQVHACTLRLAGPTVRVRVRYSRLLSVLAAVAALEATTRTLAYLLRLLSVQAAVAAFEATLEDGSIDKRGRQRAMKKMLQPLIDRQRCGAR